MKAETQSIGEKIKAVFDESGLSITQFATRLHCDRANVYNIFRRKKIDIELLLEISDILAYNFIEEFYLKNRTSQPIPSKITFVFELNNVNFKTFSKITKIINQLDFNSIKRSEKS
jgi:transcriptional regulator with XRE-family HTH domain